MKKNNLIILMVVLMCIAIIILYLLILNLGYIDNNTIFTPTGNVDIFEINCDCDKDDQCPTEPDKPAFGEDPEIDENKLIVSDNYTMWGDKKVRIFSNPSYEYTSKIAPGSFNSYTFVIKNNTDFDVIVDFEMIEENPHNVNLKYKLRSKGNYLVGDTNNYDDVSKLQLRNVKIKAHESIPYILDWKWIDSENDTEIGETVEANYKLTINIGANQTH